MRIHTNNWHYQQNNSIERNRVVKKKKKKKKEREKIYVYNIFTTLTQQVLIVTNSKLNSSLKFKFYTPATANNNLLLKIKICGKNVVKTYIKKRKKKRKGEIKYMFFTVYEYMTY